MGSHITRKVHTTEGLHDGSLIDRIVDLHHHLHKIARMTSAIPAEEVEERRID